MASFMMGKLAKRIKELRTKTGLTQERFAESIGVKYKYYQEYEGKRPRDIRLSTLEKISSGFKLPLWKLLKF